MPEHYKDHRVFTHGISAGTVPTRLNKTGDWRFMTPVRREKTSPCTADCPLHNDIAGWTRLLQEGDWDGAWQLLSAHNPFPLLTGHVCYRFCEKNCNRGHYDEAVAIGELEKAIGRRRTGTGEPLASNGSFRRVAVVGSGPAGMACAYYLSRLGFSVDVLEKEKAAGGLPALAIPDYRLPGPVVETELAMLNKLGVRIILGFEVGKDLSLEELRQKYDAVFAATGTSGEKKLDIPGENLPGVMGAVEFLRQVKSGRYRSDARFVVVIGGGNAALDAAGVAAERGAQVTVAYRRSREAMPAHPEEIKAAKERGVHFLFEVQPEAVTGGNRAEGIRFLRTQSTRRGEKPETVPGSSFGLKCDLVLVATGLEQDWSFAGNRDLLQSPLTGVFTGGDLATGPANVASAIFSGREGARLIASYLEPGLFNSNRRVLAPPYVAGTPVVGRELTNPSNFRRERRADRPELEAGRCLSCGKCNFCGICWFFCPDMAVRPEGDLGILTDYCKGCGICARECPGGVLEMEVAANDGA